MSQSITIFLKPISSNGLFRHYIQISILQLYDCPFAYWLTFVKPLIMQRWAFSFAKSYSNYFLSLSISMKTDSTFLRVEIIVTLSRQLLCFLDVLFDVILQIIKNRNIFPWYNSSFLFFVVRFLRFISKA